MITTQQLFLKLNSVSQKVFSLDNSNPMFLRVYEYNSNIPIFKIFERRDYFEISFENGFDKEDDKEKLELLIRILQSFNVKFEVNNRFRRFIEYFSFLRKNRDDVKVYDQNPVERCHNTEDIFYSTLSPRNHNGKVNVMSKMGVVIYFNSELIGILKILGSNFLLTTTNSFLKRNMLFNLENGLTYEIENQFKMNWEHKGKQWFRVNIVGKQLPINSNRALNTRFLYTFTVLNQNNNFPEVFGKSNKVIFKEFMNRIKEFNNENKDVKEFDFEVKV